MVRSLLRADQMRDEDVLTESEHDSWVHVDLVTSGTVYFGDPTTSGSWRMGISGEDFIHQKYNGSTWETKQTVVG